MPAVFPCAPDELKSVLELCGYQVHQGDMLNWAMVRGKETPIILPKRGDFVSMDCLYSVFAQSGLTPGTYLALLEQVRTDKRRASSQS
jgi:hypothetical protein